MKWNTDKTSFVDFISLSWIKGDRIPPDFDTDKNTVGLFLFGN